MRVRLPGLCSKILVVTLVACPWVSVQADGTENLGTPSIPIASGTGIVAAGTGAVAQPATINITVPAGATIQQVLAYWSGEFVTVSDNAIMIDGNTVTGTSIGGPTVFFSNVRFESFRADITGMGLVSTGANSLTVDGMSFDRDNHGAGLLIIFDDPSANAANIDVRDGHDLAFRNFAAPLHATVAQTFNLVLPVHQ